MNKTFFTAKSMLGKKVMSVSQVSHPSYLVVEMASQIRNMLTLHSDCNTVLAGKTFSGSLCVHINTDWCMKAVLVCSYCSVTVGCRHFYLPWELAMAKVHRAINELHNSHPNGPLIVTRDFNSLPKFHQYVGFPKRVANMLDCVYITIADAYHAEPRPHLSYSEHVSVKLMPACRLLLRHSKLFLKQTFLITLTGTCLVRLQHVAALPTWWSTRHQ